MLYVWDQKTSKPVSAPGCQGLREKSEDETIRLEGIDAALEGRHDATDAKGQNLVVATVFERLKTTLEDYDIDRVASVTGLGKEDIQALA